MADRDISERESAAAREAVVNAARRVEESIGSRSRRASHSSVPAASFTATSNNNNDDDANNDNTNNTTDIANSSPSNVQGGANNGIEHAANESREEAPIDNANEADGDPLNAGLTSSSLHDKLWDREVIQVIHNLTSGGGRPSNSEKQQPVVTLADLFKKSPHLRGISYDLHPSDRYIQEVCWAPPGVARTVHLLTTPLRKFASENEKVDEDNLLMSDMVVCLMRWAFSTALLSTYFPDSPTVEISWLMSHLTNTMFAVNSLSFSSRQGGPVAGLFYHRKTCNRVAEALRRGGDPANELRLLSDFSENDALRACNDAISHKEKKKKSWWGSNAGYRNSYSGKRPRKEADKTKGPPK
ncbi:hypothetical protein Pmar_PMAR015735 [Perkinsus marinus ATCC 50983]|uniref:Uncharacterized protein n=2 Tax=Perkinsus marinus (strain ATCC 50983 / TXsc) TaxID=423536 RepID=C5LWA7_PERM5|nr:hypothetical protein Pmar_PMAR015735 [Perkinsus marinus ATCC 50983]EEQ98985.1 hypothetical protein Pmar_PMAR015735 [Perkinsus marinus ATCC 50983]|eukprot:XP_002766268.1 hypothetical protein Pmar_PMAR015735 [Perkinsus marinus ATCC 50983]